MSQQAQSKHQPLIQVKLPPEMNSMFDDIRKVRADKFEPTSNKSIIIDAVKEMHARIQEQQ